MDLETFLLLSGEGQAALAEAAALEPTDPTFLAHFGHLHKRYPADLAKAALEIALLRARAKEKFAAADRMYFTREALEQATSEPVARLRARRFAPFGRVADLCCGIGADTLALASAGLEVEAVESDPLRAAMAEANVAALGLADRVRVHVADALTAPLDVNAAFADPARRADGRRFLNPEDYTPPLSALRGRFGAGSPLCVKAAPGISQSDLAYLDAEAEFVSLGGELKECALWFGPLKSAARRATVLPSGETLSAEVPREPQPLAEVGAVLYDPDPAITRAGLAFDLAERLGAAPIDHQVQLLTAQHHMRSVFATAFAVEHVAPFHAKLLREYLRSRSVGRVTIIKRGSPADADELMRKLKLDGPHHRTLFLTQADGRHTMIVCERVGTKSGYGA